MAITWKADSTREGLLISISGQPVAHLRGRNGTRDKLTFDGEAILWERVSSVAVKSMEMRLDALFVAEHCMVPAVSYDGNKWGDDHEYKGYEWEGTTYTFAAHRTPIPAASASWNRRFSVALCTPDTVDVSGSMLPGPETTIHRVIWPEIEEPRVLYSRTWAPSYRGTMNPKKTFLALIYVRDTVTPAWQCMLRDFWRRTYVSSAPCLSTHELWQRGVAYAKVLYTQDGDGFRGFNIGLSWDGQAWTKRQQLKYEIGWCGQNASLAVSLLVHSQMYDDQDSRQMGYSVLDSWLERARSQSGLLLTRYDPPNMPIDAVNLGTAGLQYYEAWQMANLLGDDKPAYRAAFLEICEFALERQRLDGGIGVSWDPDGNPLQLHGTSGAFLIPVLVAAFLETGDEKYNTAAVRAYSYYYNQFHKDGYGTAGALDTYCIDKESAIPLLKGALMLCHATGYKRYLIWAEEVAWYLSTWQWHFSVKYPEGTLLHEIGYDTYGGTSVSTSHHHLDPFALCYVTDLIELADLTGNEQWRERAFAIWRNGLQGISDGTLTLLGKSARPIGSQDEGYLHTRWGHIDMESACFTVSQWLVAWPTAFRLEVLRGTTSWNTLDAIGEHTP